VAKTTRVAVLLSPTKMSSKPHAPPSPMTTRRGGFWRDYFYFFMSLLIAATAVYGFSHTIDHNLIHRSPLPPFVLYIHAIVFPAWIVFFIVQSALVRSHNVHLHRRLGWFGVGLAVAIVAVIFYNYFSVKVENISAIQHINDDRLIDAALQGKQARGN